MLRVSKVTVVRRILFLFIQNFECQKIHNHYVYLYVVVSFICGFILVMISKVSPPTNVRPKMVYFDLMGPWQIFLRGFTSYTLF